VADSVPAWGENPTSPLYQESYRKGLRKAAILGTILGWGVMLGSMPLLGLGVKAFVEGVPYQADWKVRTSGARSLQPEFATFAREAWTWETDSGDFLLLETDTSEDINGIAETIHEARMGSLGHPAALRVSHPGLAGPFRAWDSPLPDGRILRTGTGFLPDREILWQEFRRGSEFDALGEFQARGWLVQGTLGYPLRRWFEVGGLLAMVVFWMWIVYWFGLRTFRVRKPPGTVPVPPETLEARLLGINALTDRFRLESVAPGVLECPLPAEGGEWVARGRHGDTVSERFLRFRLVPSAGDVRVISGSSSRSVSSSGTGFGAQWSWGRGASYLPVYSESHPAVWWQDGMFHAAKGRALTDDSEYLQALVQCCLESGWNLQPAIW
jgi:hypothetical protein